ncbi:Ig-like domain-containing alpha-2-macroglobulin family protein [Longibacter salinarum]|nr:Ig-like domain-containing alpha-2-macroglobulin family protein [Longibacter salinarum]
MSGPSALPRFTVFLAAILLGLTLAHCGGSNKEASQAALRERGYDIGTADLPERANGATNYTPTLQGPLRVLSSSPTGSMHSQNRRQPITVTFSKPMVPIGPDPAIPEDAIELAPAVPGSLRWEGTQTLVFQPARDLPVATTMTATVRADITSLDGESLDDTYTWSFETPRPRLTASTPEDGARYADPSATVKLSFSLPVSVDDIRPYLSIDASRTSNPYTIEQANDTLITLTPQRALPKGANVRIIMKKGLPTSAGELGFAEDREVAFRVRPDLSVVEMNQGGRGFDSRFYPGNGMYVGFSTPVEFGKLKEAISFDPDVQWPDNIDSRSGSEKTVHRLPVTFEPETSYRVRIEGLTDVFGQSMSVFARSFQTRPYRPQLQADQGMMVIEADQYPIIPVQATNAGGVDIGMRSFSKDDVVPLLSNLNRYGDDREEYFQQTIPRNRYWDFGLERNAPSVVPMRLDSMLTDSTGLVGINMRWDRPNSDYDAEYEALAQVTSLGVTGKFSPYENLVFVTRLNNAEPVRGASVEIRDETNKVLWSGTTDANGRAKTPGWWALGIERTSSYRAPKQFVIVEHGEDLAVTSSEFDDGVEPYRFGINYDRGPEAQSEKAIVFSDRGLYKVGETVHLKGFVRQKTDGAWSNLTDPIDIDINDPRNEDVLDSTVSPGTMGSFDLSWDVPEDGARGRYTVRVHHEDETIEYASFRVEDFRRATMDVDATTTAKQYVAGDFFEGSISGRYLFGASMEGQPAQFRLSKSDTRYTPPGYPSYRFGPTDAREYGTLLRGEQPLDSTGAVTIRHQLEGNNEGTPVRLTWSGTVTSPTDQTMSAATSATMHPGLFYIGLKAETTFLDLKTDTTFTVDIMTTDPGGVPVGGKDVDIEVVHVQWNSVQEVGADGRLRWRSERTEEVIYNTSITTSASKAQRLSMVLPRGGRYEIRAKAQDLRGNEIRTDTHAYATGRGYVAWRRDDDDRIDIVPNKETYAPGETAKLLVQSPYEDATALVTVEREGIISSRVMQIDKTAPQINIPIEAKHLPNIYVSVILLSGRTAPPQKTSDPGAPGFKIGYTSLRVDANEKHLRVDVSPEETQYRPGEEITVDLRLTDASGSGVSGEIAFSAADAGVLDLIGYSLPDPFDTFYGPRALNVTTSELRAELVEQRDYGQKTEDPGGGGGVGRNAVRTDFRPLAHWAPSVRTGNDGRAQLTFKLPESLTTFRLMAAAASRDQAFGKGQANIVVTKPLVLQQAMPRFARLNDDFQAGVLVSNRTDEDGTVEVTAEPEGGLALAGASTQSINLPAGATREVRFDWSADQPGNAAVRFRASLNGETDAFETTVPVQLPRTKLADGTFSSTDGTQEEAIVLAGNRIPGAGEFSMKLSSTALVGLDGAIEHLFEYPYGCLEQTTSRVRPLLLANDVVDAFDIEVMDGDRNAAVQSWLRSLRSFWAGNGFSLWEGSRHDNPYVTGYVLLGLAEAQDAGYDTPSSLTRKTIEAVEAYVRNRSERPAFYSRDVWKTTRAQMLYALTRHGHVLESEIDALASDPPASPEGLSFLLRALVAADHDALSRFEPSIAERLRSMIRVEATRAYLDAPDRDDYRWIFSSDVRATAFGLSALIEHGGGDGFQQVAQRMVRYLMAERQNGHWASTQDNAAAVDALRAYYDAFETANPDFRAEIKLAGRTVLQESFEGRSLRAATDTVGLGAVPSGREVPVTVSKDGTGTVYYSLRLEAYTADPVPAREQGMVVERRIQRLDDSGSPVGEWMTTGEGNVSLTPGQLVRVRLRVSSPTSRNYVVVDDALPAGLEPINAAFATTSGEISENAETGSDRWWGSFNHTEKRDDRVLLFADYLQQGEHAYTYVARATTRGTYTHPPAEAEMMYEPETRGRTATGTLIVTEPPAQAGR